MENYKSELQYKTKGYLGIVPVTSLKIMADVVKGEPASLEATTLFVFDGISLGKLNIDEAIRTKLVWNYFGRLSMAQVEHTHSKKYKKILSTAVVKAGLSIVYLTALNYFIDAYKDIKKKEEVSKREFDLRFSGTSTNNKALRGKEIGKFSYSATKYDRLRKRSKGIEEFKKKTGIDPTETLENKLEHRLEEYPFVISTSRYDISEDSVNFVLGQPCKVKQKNKYPQPSIILRKTIDLGGLNPNDHREKHVIHAVTKIKGVEKPYVDRKIILGPDYLDEGENDPKKILEFINRFLVNHEIKL